MTMHRHRLRDSAWRDMFSILGSSSVNALLRLYQEEETSFPILTMISRAALNRKKITAFSVPLTLIYKMTSAFVNSRTTTRPILQTQRMDRYRLK